MTSPHFPALQRLFADILEVPADQITPQSTPDTVDGWDSIRHMNLILSIEGEFGFEFTQEEIERIDDMEKLLAFLDQRTGA